jgi:hypothetical protein
MSIFYRYLYTHEVYRNYNIKQTNMKFAAKIIAQDWIINYN